MLKRDGSHGEREDPFFGPPRAFADEFARSGRWRPADFRPSMLPDRSTVTLEWPIDTQNSRAGRANVTALADRKLRPRREEFARDRQASVSQARQPSAAGRRP